jgi:hypothetical protein
MAYRLIVVVMNGVRLPALDCDGAKNPHAKASGAVGDPRIKK